MRVDKPGRTPYQLRVMAIAATNYGLEPRRPFCNMREWPQQKKSRPLEGQPNEYTTILARELEKCKRGGVPA